MSAPRTVPLLAATLTLASLLAACSDQATDPLGPSFEPVPEMAVSDATPPAPPDLVPVSFGGQDLQLWPWTGRDVAGTVADPINLLFFGEVDVVSLRAALLSLDGNRTAFGFPDAFPFNCTWSDAHGEYQTAYSSGDGWVANAVQLQCGSYDPLRFHIRFFEAGGWVMAGTHFDVLIPNTAEHQVISWDLPQQLVMVDFLRSGVLDSSVPFYPAPLTSPGTVQEIHPAVYNGMPSELKVAFGYPPGTVTDPVPIPNDGVATIVNVATRPEVEAGVWESDFVMTYNLVVPRPFCRSGDMDYVHLQGPLRLTTRTMVNRQGILETHNTLRGELQVTPIDVSTQMPSGIPFRALISEIDNTGAGPMGTHVNAILRRMALPPGQGELMTHLRTGPNGMAGFTFRERC